MHYRTFGRLGWLVSEIGHGTWGMGTGPSSWKGSSDEESIASLSAAIDGGVNFIDTAWVYGRGHSERLIGKLLINYKDRKIYVASKIPPKNFSWPSKRGDDIRRIFPGDHMLTYTKRTLANLGQSSVDLMLFHVWEDDWHKELEWQKMVQFLKKEGMVRAFGISVNTWEPWNVQQTLDTGLIDAVEVVYNIFEQRPEDQLFADCEKAGVAVIGRVPFDEGSLIGTMTTSTTFDKDDWRSSYFVGENLEQCIPRVEKIKEILPTSMSMAHLALRFILDNPLVATVIPGMRRIDHVAENLAVSDAPPLSGHLLAEIRKHRWDRLPTSWSQ
jgi:aryl-alcohol dehydrogenase-like predicted oxidoreductase